MDNPLSHLQSGRSVSRILLHEDSQAGQNADWRRGWDKRGEVQTLDLPRPVSGSPKRADADQGLQGRRTESVGDAAQPLQQHGDALLEKFTTLRLEPSEGIVDYLTRAEYVSKQLELAGGKLAKIC